MWNTDDEPCAVATTEELLDYFSASSYGSDETLISESETSRSPRERTSITGFFEARSSKLRRVLMDRRHKVIAEFRTWSRCSSDEMVAEFDIGTEHDESNTRCQLSQPLRLGEPPVVVRALADQ